MEVERCWRPAAFTFFKGATQIRKCGFSLCEQSYCRPVHIRRAAIGIEANLRRHECVEIVSEMKVGVVIHSLILFAQFIRYRWRLR